MPLLPGYELGKPLVRQERLNRVEPVAQFLLGEQCMDVVVTRPADPREVVGVVLDFLVLVSTHDLWYQVVLRELDDTPARLASSCHRADFGSNQPIERTGSPDSSWIFLA